MFGVSESMKTAVRHYKEGNLNWPMIIYLSLAHIAGLIGLLSITECHKYTLLWAFILWPIRYFRKRESPLALNFDGTVSTASLILLSPIPNRSGVGITGGVHRLWAHRSYKASFPLRVYLMLSNSIANQGITIIGHLQNCSCLILEATKGLVQRHYIKHRSEVLK